MLTFLLRLFAAVVFLALAATWIKGTHQLQWAYGASAAFVVSFLIENYGPAFPGRQPSA